MPTEAQLAANRANAQHSTGARTEEGRIATSRNATTFGLFSKRDFVPPRDREEYAKIAISFWEQLSPIGTLEQAYVAEIVSATWRLHRCARLEAEMAEAGDAAGLAAAHADTGLAAQTSIDRARAQAHTLLRRSTADLRRLQTEATARHQVFQGNPIPKGVGLTSYKEVFPVVAAGEKLGLICKTASRNSACPCGSGQKYKRCCGRPAPAVLTLAA